MNKIFKKTFCIYLLCIGLILVQYSDAQTMKPLYQNKKFALYSDSVVQGNYTSKVLNAGELTSNYQSPANLLGR